MCSSGGGPPSPASRPRSAGQTSRAAHSVLSMLGGWRKVPIIIKCRRSEKPGHGSPGWLGAVDGAAAGAAAAVGA